MFLAKRFLADFRSVGGWVVAIALAVFVVSALSTYMAVFTVTESRSGLLSIQAPYEPLGFLRVADPTESIVARIEFAEDLEKSVLDEPSLQILLESLLDDPRMFVVLPLSAFTFDWRSGGDVDPNVRAVMGTSPPFIGESPVDGEILLWGSVSDGVESSPGVSNNAIHGHPVRQVSEEPLEALFVGGNGHPVNTGSAALVAFDVPTGRSLGVTNPYHVSEVVRGFTCYCHTSELADLAEAMSDSESQSGTGRVFYTIDYDGLVGPIQRSRALAGLLSAGFALGTLLAVWCLIVMVAQVLWTRRSHVYLVERLHGSSEIALQLRGQILIGLSLTLPALGAYGLVNASLRLSTWPPPLPAEATVIALAGVIALHTLAGGVNAGRIHRLCKLGRDGARHA